MSAVLDIQTAAVANFLRSDRALVALAREVHRDGGNYHGLASALGDGGITRTPEDLVLAPAGNPRLDTDYLDWLLSRL